MYICSSTVKWSIETQGTSQHLSEPKASVQQGTRQKEMRKARMASATQGEPEGAPGVKDPLSWLPQGKSEHGRTDPTKSFSRRLRAFLKSDKGSELQLLITRQLKKYKILDDHLYKATPFPPPHVVHAPRCPPTPHVQLSGVGHGKREVKQKQSYCATKSLSICWGKPGAQSLCFSSCSGDTRKIFPFPSYSWKVSSSQDWKWTSWKDYLLGVEKVLSGKSLSSLDKHSTFHLTTVVTPCPLLNDAGQSLVMIQF